MTATHELLKSLCVREWEQFLLQYLFTLFIMRELSGEFFPTTFSSGASGIIFMESGVGFMRAILVHIFMMPLVYQFLVWYERCRCVMVFFIPQGDSNSETSAFALSRPHVYPGSMILYKIIIKILSAPVQQKSMRKPWTAPCFLEHTFERNNKQLQIEQAGKGVYVIYHKRERRRKQTIPHMAE